MKQSLSTTAFFASLLVAGASAFVPAITGPRRAAAASGVCSSSTKLAETTASVDNDDKTEVREYFNTEGFNRWNKIYSESDDVNNVQLDIRNGHDQTIQKILNWMRDDDDIAGQHHQPMPLWQPVDPVQQQR